MTETSPKEIFTYVGETHPPHSAFTWTPQAVIKATMLMILQIKMIACEILFEYEAVNVKSDLEFVKKFTRPNFRAKEFYTLKMRKSRQFLPAINS